MWTCKTCGCRIVAGDGTLPRVERCPIGYASRITAAKGKMTPQDETALPIVARALSEGWNLTKNPNLIEI